MTTDPRTHLDDGHYHVCFAVPDLHAAMDELTGLLGLGWGEPQRGRLGDWPYAIVFSDRNPHIELISSVAGSPWDAPEPRFHHLGWWTRCLDETAAAWTADERTLFFDGREHGRSFVYADAPASGARLEAVASSQRQAFLDRWAAHRQT